MRTVAHLASGLVPVCQRGEIPLNYTEQLHL